MMLANINGTKAKKTFEHLIKIGLVTEYVDPTTTWGGAPRKFFEVTEKGKKVMKFFKDFKKITKMLEEE